MNDGFWRLSHTDSTKERADWDESVEIEQIYCSVNSNHRRAGKRLTTLTVNVPSGPTLDFVWTWTSDCLIGNRVLDLFREHNFTGFEVRPAFVRRERGTQVIEVNELIITGWGGIAPPESGVSLIEECRGCGFNEYSDVRDGEHLIDRRQYDGSDFFMVWPFPAFIFVTDRVATLIKKTKLTGAMLQRPSELKRGLLGKVSPGRLSLWMPESRAKELGEPLGIY